MRRLALALVLLAVVLILLACGGDDFRGLTPSLDYLNDDDPATTGGLVAYRPLGELPPSPRSSSG